MVLRIHDKREEVAIQVIVQEEKAQSVQADDNNVQADSPTTKASCSPDIIVPICEYQDEFDCIARNFLYNSGNLCEMRLIEKPMRKERETY